MTKRDVILRSHQPYPHLEPPDVLRGFTNRVTQRDGAMDKIDPSVKFTHTPPVTVE
jgi:hypothetical protein